MLVRREDYRDVQNEYRNEPFKLLEVLYGNYPGCFKHLFAADRADSRPHWTV